MSKSTPSLRGSRLITMFCATVKLGTSMKCWCTMPTPIEMAVLGEKRSTFLPRIYTSPFVGSWMP